MLTGTSQKRLETTGLDVMGLNFSCLLTALTLTTIYDSSKSFKNEHLE